MTGGPVPAPGVSGAPAEQERAYSELGKVGGEGGFKFPFFYAQKFIPNPLKSR